LKVEAYQGQVEVEAEAYLNPSEDEAKVSRALNNILPGAQVEKRDERLVARAEGYQALEPLYRQVRERQVITALRRMLRAHSEGGETWVYLNRQAAFVGRLAVCEEPEESPLGPIVLRVRAEDLEGFIDWLAPEV
jgi:hypothetical protein